VKLSKLSISLCVAAALAASGSVMAKGGNTTNMTVGTDLGLYLVDQPFPGEASIGGWVLARLSTGTIPSDIVVTINGTRLIHPPELAALVFVVDPNGPQPSVGADNMLHIVASSASFKASRQLDLQCPARAVVATNPGVGSNLGAAGSLDMAWTALPQNTEFNLIGGYIPFPTATLYSYDLATGASAGTVSRNVLDQTLTSTTLAVGPSAATGYVAELAYPGTHKVVEQDAGGWCGRKQRYIYMQ
jgi:hypothetical protein